MSTNIRTLIIEDEPAAVNRLSKELNKVESVVFEVLEVIDSVKEAVSWIQEHDEVELIFMDIQIRDGLSLEIFRQVKVKSPVIFTTAYDEYALQAFKVNSIDYLLKPVNTVELKAAVTRYLELRQGPADNYMQQLTSLVESYKPSNYRSSFLVSYRHKMIMIDVNEVAYLYVKERGVFMKKKDGLEYMVDFYLDDLEKQLDPARFYRANRQFLVARAAIREIETYFNGRLILTVVPESTTPIIISKGKAAEFKRWADY